MVGSFPLHWPSGYTRTDKPKSSAFKVTFAKARDEAIKQIRILGGNAVIISSNIPVRLNGLPYANFSKVDDPGIAIYFTYNNEQVVFCCDKWDKPEANMKAIANTIDAIRGMNRWGVSEMMQRMFTGFKQLPEHTSSLKWWEVFDIDKNSTEQEIKSQYRCLIQIHHPDKGGKREDFDAIQEAYKQAISTY
jgi:hypothetical protein